MSTGYLTARQLCRYYQRGPQEVRAVHQVDLDIAAGEFLGLVGPSGSGKSTLLNLLAGLDTPTSGQIEFESIALHELSTRGLAAYRAHRVGMVFQSFNLLGYKTAVENVEMALYFDAVPRSERRPRARAALERLGLADRLDHKPADLSGGEQQRVALARALVKRPDLLFADEPTGNLDHDNAVQIGDLLRELNHAGLTVVLVTHDMAFADRCARRVVRMDYGSIVADSGKGGDR